MRLQYARGLRRFALVCGVVLLSAGMFTAGWWAKVWEMAHSSATISNYALNAVIRTTGMQSDLNFEKVDVFGGSMAHGWLDPNDDSYLRRAFATRSESTNTMYDYIDHTIIGETPVMLNQSDPDQYEQWLVQDQPQVVVLSWGLLNSMSSRHAVSATVFASAVKQEIAEALGVHAVVLIVTPPVTEESATVDHAKQEIYLNHLFAVAKSFHNANVVICDVYHQMEVYLAAHGQTYQDYYGNSWHPNQAGHELAGMLLANDLTQAFGDQTILYRSQSTA